MYFLKFFYKSTSENFMLQ